VRPFGSPAAIGRGDSDQSMWPPRWCHREGGGLVAPARRSPAALAGTEATAGLLLERDTTAPPLGAAPLRVAVPVEEVPPVTLTGFRVSEDRDLKAL